MNEKELLDLKEQIEDAKNEVNKLEGRREHLMQQLSDDWDCESLEEAKKKLGEIKASVKQTDEKIQKGVKKIQEKYELA